MWRCVQTVDSPSWTCSQKKCVDCSKRKVKAEKFKIDKSQNASRQVKVEFVVSDFCVFACPFAGLGMLSCVCVCVSHSAPRSYGTVLQGASGPILDASQRS